MTRSIVAFAPDCPDSFPIRVSPKPGSILADGSVMDYQGFPQASGPCFIPADISPRRKGILGSFGWCLTPAKDWPSILPREDLGCIVRVPALDRHSPGDDEFPL